MFDCWFDDIMAWFTDHVFPVGVSIILAGYAVFGILAPEQLHAIDLSQLATMIALGTAPTLFLLVSYTPLVQLWWKLGQYAPLLPNSDPTSDDKRFRRHAVAWTLVITASAAFGTALRAFM